MYLILEGPPTSCKDVKLTKGILTDGEQTLTVQGKELQVKLLSIENNPFYNSVLSGQAFEQKRGWVDFVMIQTSVCFLCYHAYYCHHKVNPILASMQRLGYT